MTDEISTFEKLFKQKEKLAEQLWTLAPAIKSGYEKRKADKSADLDDFIEMVSFVVSKCMRNPRVFFQPDEGARYDSDQGTKIDSPYIFYQLISRIPKNELKPREREEFMEKAVNPIDARAGRVYGQRYICSVQFNILADDYRNANKVTRDFEELMFKYTSYFKQNGVAELLFKRQFTDNNLDVYRQSVSVRSLEYYVEIEKLYTIYASEILDVPIVK